MIRELVSRSTSILHCGDSALFAGIRDGSSSVKEKGRKYSGPEPALRLSTSGVGSGVGPCRESRSRFDSNLALMGVGGRSWLAERGWAVMRGGEGRRGVGTTGEDCGGPEVARERRCGSEEATEGSEVERDVVRTGGKGGRVGETT